MASASPQTPRVLLAVVAAAVLVPLATGAFAAWLTWRSTWAAHEAATIRAADAAAEYALRVLDSHRLAAERVNDLLRGLSDDEVRARDASLHATLRQTSALGVLSVFVLSGDPAAEAILSGNIHPLPRGSDFSDREWVRALADPATPEPFVSSIHQGRIDRSLFFSVNIRRRPAPDAPPAGVISVSVDPNTVARGMGRLAEHPTDLQALIRADGQLLAFRRGLTAPPQPLPPGAAFRAVMATLPDRATYRATEWSTGEPALFAARRVEGYPIYAVTGRREAVIRAEWWASVRTGLAWGIPAALALLVVALLALREARRAARAADDLRREAARRAAEARFRGVFESRAFGMSVYDLRTGETLLINDRLLEMTGRTRGPHGGPAEAWRDITPPEHAAADERALEQARNRGWWDPYEKEYSLPDGSRIPVRLHSAPLPGEPGRIVVVVEDITAQREAESRRDLLMHEVNHRAKNALAAARAALRLTRAPTMPEFVEAVDGRLAALATAMGTLSAGGWSSVSLDALARDALAPFGAPFRGPGARGDRIVAEGPDLKIQPLAVLPISMILHELATNAGKHGALSVPGGRVTLRWRVAGERLSLSWSESSGPPVTAPRGTGFGTRLLDATVTRQLGGTARADWAPEGLSWRADLPLARVATAPPVLVPA